MPAELDVVLIRVSQQTMGVPLQQISHIRPWEEVTASLVEDGETVTAPKDLASALGYEPSPASDASRALYVTDENTGAVGWHVSAVADIVSIPLIQIRPLPAVLRDHAAHCGVWGVALLDEVPIPLLDLTRLESVHR
ncbi:MAG TPA: chemotaxis protein CheW [Anaerolineae bacterium]|nr:chemotaxis protein CheW [Anaerolineae bacterium]HIQ04304.1 chemotaxis protein CheW [Anaerolineae bacterium]